MGGWLCVQWGVQEKDTIKISGFFYPFLIPLLPWYTSIHHSLWKIPRQGTDDAPKGPETPTIPIEQESPRFFLGPLEVYFYSYLLVFLMCPVIWEALSKAVGSLACWICTGDHIVPMLHFGVPEDGNWEQPLLHCFSLGKERKQGGNGTGEKGKKRQVASRHLQVKCTVWLELLFLCPDYFLWSTWHNLKSWDRRKFNWWIASSVRLVCGHVWERTSWL